MLEREGKLEGMALRPPPDEWWDEYFAEIENPTSGTDLTR
jgi:hypothetical protein